MLYLKSSFPLEAMKSFLKGDTDSKTQDWPNTGCGSCRVPGVEPGNPGPSFPVYFTYKNCTETEVRVAYNLFYEKDGFALEGISGHPYDWERVIVKWARGSDGRWTPRQLMMSQHMGYQTLDWEDIPNTMTTDVASMPQAGGGRDGRKGLDHAKVYVGWSKHGNFEDPNTFFVDVLSQMFGYAYRSQDWWYFPTSGE